MSLRDDGGWYKLGAYDAKMICSMVGAISDARSRPQRGRMALYCWSQMHDKSKPCPCFRVGLRTIANKCEVSVKTARAFMDRAERDGYIIRLGKVINKRGSYEKRTFVWVAEEAADNDGMELDEWLQKVGGCAQIGAHPRVPNKEVRAHGCAQTPEGKGTHQSTEYSEEGVSRPSFEVGARTPSGLALSAQPERPKTRRTEGGN